jgi:hypothetical protein
MSPGLDTRPSSAEGSFLMEFGGMRQLQDPKITVNGSRRGFWGHSPPKWTYTTLSYPILSYPILSFPVLSCPVLSCPILSYPILSYPILSYPILSYPILSYPILLSVLPSFRPSALPAFRPPALLSVLSSFQANKDKVVPSGLVADARFASKADQRVAQHERKVKQVCRKGGEWKGSGKEREWKGSESQTGIYMCVCVT